MNATCYIENNELYWGGGIPARAPAILACQDNNDCILLKYGEAENCRKYRDKYAAAYRAAGIGEVQLVELDPERLTLQERCYVIRRSVEYSANRFIGQLLNKINHEPDQVLEWLRSEMARVVIEL